MKAGNLPFEEDDSNYCVKGKPRQLGLKRDAQGFASFSRFFADESLRRYKCLFQVSFFRCPSTS